MKVVVAGRDIGRLPGYSFQYHSNPFFDVSPKKPLDDPGGQQQAHRRAQQKKVLPVAEMLDKFFGLLYRTLQQHGHDAGNKTRQRGRDHDVLYPGNAATNKVDAVVIGAHHLRPC